MTPEERRVRVGEMRGKLAALQKEYSRETGAEAKQRLQVEIATLQRGLQALLNELGVAGVPTKKGRPMTDAQAALHLPTKEMTPSMIADLAAAGMATPEGAAALAAHAAAGSARPLVLPWVVPAMSKAPDVPSIAQWFAECKSFKALQPVQRVDKDPHYKKGGGLINFVTNKPVTTFVGQDTEWISLLQQVKGEYGSKIYSSLTKAVRSHFVGSGPLDGWFARIQAGDKIRRPQFSLQPEELELVLKQLPFDAVRVRALKDLTCKEALDTITVNPTADAGFPRSKKKGMCMPDLIADAVQYFDLLAAKGFNQYARDHPGEFVSTCKNKLDRYEMKDYGQKVRPYFNLNGGLAMLYSVVVQNYSKALKGFWEDRESCNAHGFAWNAGGGQRIYEWLMWVRGQKSGVYAICYSDDGLWAIVTEDRRVLVSDKDIAQCDMSVSSSHMPTMLRHVRDVCGDKLGPGWQQVAVRAISNIWTQVVILYGSLAYLSTDKVHSGSVGTAEADQIGASTMLALIRGAYDRAPGQPEERFRKAEEVVEQRTGLKFKPSGWTEFQPDQREYHFKFLGKSLLKIGDQYYPHVDLDKCVVQLITPKRSLGGMIGQRSWMERARGLGVTSLWTHSELYEYVKAAYERKLVLGYKPADTFEGSETGERDLDQIMGQCVGVEWTCGDKFPERDWVKALYSLPGTTATATTKAARETTVTVLVPKQAVSVGDLIDELFPEQDAHLWADRDDRAMEVRGQAVGKLGDGQRIAALPVVPVNPGPAQYLVAPLPESVKAAFREARQRAREALRVVQGGSKAFVRKGSKLAGYERGDYGDVIFTRSGITRAYEESVTEEIEGYESPDVDYFSEAEEFGEEEPDDRYWDRVRVRYARGPQEEELWLGEPGGDEDEAVEAR